MTRYKLIIEGDVQQIGFREHIKKEALKLKIKGSAKNLDDGSVEVYCDVSDLLLDQFKTLILAYHDIEVTNIKIIKETDPEFQPDTDFKAFKVIRSEDEVAETLSVMTATGIAMNQEMKGMHQEMKGMHQDMNKRFDTLDEKYGKISEIMLRFLDKMDDHNNKLDKILELLTKPKK
ncbi:MAG: acylphosphatase [Thermoplasmata archaeon]